MKKAFPSKFQVVFPLIRLFPLDRSRFAQLFASIAVGVVFAQEPTQTVQTNTVGLTIANWKFADGSG
jgi:hypothetical protein